MFEGPEKKFQRHIGQYLVREHRYAVLEQDEITDTEYYFAEDHQEFHIYSNKINIENA